MNKSHRGHECVRILDDHKSFANACLFIISSRIHNTLSKAKESVERNHQLCLTPWIKLEETWKETSCTRKKQKKTIHNVSVVHLSCFYWLKYWITRYIHVCFHCPLLFHSTCEGNNDCIITSDTLIQCIWNLAPIVVIFLWSMRSSTNNSAGGGTGDSSL